MLTAARLRELLSYDPETGVFRWRVYRARNARAGDVAGRIIKAAPDKGGGYRSIGIDGSEYLAQRLAWLHMTGEWPPAQVDHENRNRDDNAWRNLRDATRSQNQANRPAQANNTSGFKGVAFHKGAGRWRATLGKRHLGLFDSPEQAHAAYAEAARGAFGEFARAA